MKGLNFLKKDTKYQETSYNFRLGFALSNRPHFNSTYLPRVPFSSGIAVLTYMEKSLLDQEDDFDYKLAFIFYFNQIYQIFICYQNYS